MDTSGRPMLPALHRSIPLSSLGIDPARVSSVPVRQAQVAVSARAPAPGPWPGCTQLPMLALLFCSWLAALPGVIAQVGDRAAEGQSSVRLNEAYGFVEV